MEQKKEYYAFISYKREDKKEAKRLQHALEYYRLPNHLRQENPELPEYVRPVFRDMTDLEVGELSAQIHSALEQSHYLVVVCSPLAAASKWVNDEVKYFISLGKQDKIIPYIIEGVPHANNPSEECYPPALLSLSKEKELLGSNINEVGKDSATIRIISRMFNIRFDTLYQRYEREQRRKRWMWIGGSIFVALLGLSIGGYIAYQNRELRSKNIEIKAERDRSNMERDRAETANASLLIANNSIKRQYELIEQQKNKLAITNDLLNQKNIALSIANSNIKQTMQENEAKRLAEYSLKLLEEGDSYKARKVAIQALPPYYPYTPEAEHALDRADAANSFILRGIAANCAEFSPDGNYLAIGPTKGSIMLWNANNGQKLVSLTKDTLSATSIHDRCSSIAFSHDGNYLLAGLSDGTARIWNLKTFKEEGCFDAKIEGAKLKINGIDQKDWCPTNAAFSSDGRYVATTSYHSIVKIWDIKTNKLCWQIDNIVSAMEDISFRPKHKQILFKLEQTLGGDNSIIVFDLQRNKEIYRLFGNCASYSHDGRYIVMGDCSGIIMIVNAETKDTVHILKEHRGTVTSVRYSPNDKYIISSSNDNTIKLWNSKKTYKNGKYEWIWQCIKTYEGHRMGVGKVSFSPDGKRIVSISVSDNDLRVWDVSYNENNSLGLSNKSAFAIYSYDGNYFLGTKRVKLKEHFLDVDIPALYDSRTNNPIREFRGHSNDVLFATFSPNGKNFVTASRDSTLKIWSIDADSAIHTLRGHRGPINHVDYSKDGKYIVSAGYDGSIIIWNADMAKELYTGLGHEKEVRSVSFSQNGKHIVSASRDGSVRIWNNRGECQKIVIHNPNIKADFACYSPCGNIFAAGFSDGTIRIWSSCNYKELHVIKAHDTWVRYLSFSRDGKRLISCAGNTVKIWESASGIELRSIDCEGAVRTACFSPGEKGCLVSMFDYGIKSIKIPTIEELIDKVLKRKL